MNEVISFAQSDVILKVMSISANKIAAFKFIWKTLLKRKWNIILVSYKQQAIYFWHEFSFLIQMLYMTNEEHILLLAKVFNAFLLNYYQTS